MKDGPANIPTVIKDAKLYTDATFTGKEMLYTDGVSSAATKKKYDDQIARTSFPKYSFKDIFTEYKDANILDA